MFSVPKIIVLILIIGAVWYGFKLLNRRPPSGGTSNEANQAPNQAPDDAVAMVKCGVCGDFVSGEAATTCGKDGCPY